MVPLFSARTTRTGGYFISFFVSKDSLNFNALFSLCCKSDMGSLAHGEPTV
jgi:hypothetical protein